MKKCSFNWNIGMLPKYVVLVETWGCYPLFELSKTCSGIVCNGSWWLLQNTPPHWNLGRSWQFEYWLLQNPPHTHSHTHTKLKFRQILTFWVLTTTETPRWKLKFTQILAVSVFGLLQTGLLLEYVETNRCIPEVYHLVNTCDSTCKQWFVLETVIICLRR